MGAVINAGDVYGPSSSTDESIARFDGTTGKLIQDGANALLDDSGNVKVAGYLRSGSTSAPANTTAGDITATRLALGDNTAFSSASGSTAKLKGEMTDTSAGAKYTFFAQADINNASTSTSEFRSLGMSGQIKAGNTQNVGTLIGLFSETRVLGNSTTSSLIGYRTFGGVFPSTTELSGKTVSNVVGFDATGFKISGAPPNAATVTTVKGVNVNNNDAPSPITITNTIGVDIASQTRGGTLNIGARIAAPSGATNNYALQLSDTGGTAAGGITFGTDTNVYRSGANNLATDDNFTMGSLLKINAASGNPEFNFQEAGTTRAKTYYDITSNQLVFQNNESNADDALLFSDSSVFDGKMATKAGLSTGNIAKIGGTIFSYTTDAGNSGTSETDLYTDSIPADTLNTNKDKLEARYAGEMVNSATATRQLKAYFGGTAIFDTGALSLSASSEWDLDVLIIRVSSTVVRYSVKLNLTGASLSVYTNVGELTGLTLSNANTLKITGTAAGVDAATNDIVAKLGNVEWKPAP